MPYIYRCQLRLLEPTFFSSREISDLYQTEAFIGHIALCYAMGLAPSRYYNEPKRVYYRDDLAALNDQGIYVTPATILGAARFVLGQFNAQPESYWSAMGNNTLVTAPEGMWAEREQKSWYITDGTRRSKVGVENRPQIGRVRALAIGNEAEFFVISEMACTFPSYIRLGKWMSKARMTTAAAQIINTPERGQIPHLLAPADLPSTSRMLAYDLLGVSPTPLMRNCYFDGPCYQLDRTTFLPQGMRFNLEGFK
jgi:CRISPR-associated protein Csc1